LRVLVIVEITHLVIASGERWRYRRICGGMFLSSGRHGGDGEEGGGIIVGLLHGQ